MAVATSSNSEYYFARTKQPSPGMNYSRFATAESHIPAAMPGKSLIIYTLIGAFVTGDETEMTTKTIPGITIYENDPEIVALSPEELRAEFDAAFGAWADRDDLPDNWLTDLREGWTTGLDQLYGYSTEKIPS